MGNIRNSGFKTDSRRKVALVIGNSNYYENISLATVTNDAIEMASTLKNIGFLIHAERPQLDLPHKQMLEVITEFASSIQSGDMVLFYFAGHGARWEDQNYLMPVDNYTEKIEGGVNVRVPLSGPELAIHAINAQNPLNEISKQGPSITMLFLDCCRTYHLRNVDSEKNVNDEQSNQSRRRKATPSKTKYLIAFACTPRKPLIDGEKKGEKNSLFTKHLLKHMKTPNEDIRVILSSVTDGVVEESNGKQTPYLKLSLKRKNICLCTGRQDADEDVQVKHSAGKRVPHQTSDPNSPSSQSNMANASSESHTPHQAENMSKEVTKDRVRKPAMTQSTKTGPDNKIAEGNVGALLRSPVDDQRTETTAARNQHRSNADSNLIVKPNDPSSESIERYVDPSPGSTPMSSRHRFCQFHSGKNWLEPQFRTGTGGKIRKPAEVERDMDEPAGRIDAEVLNRITGSMIGMAIGDALGAHVEFRPHEYLVQNPVQDLGSGGTWGLKRGQFTDDTSMALCLANSLIARRCFDPYDQLVRYKWWFKLGYMSSTGTCFDIGSATRQSIEQFQRRQEIFAKGHNIPFEDMDYLSDSELLRTFDVECSRDGVAGNGALMRLAPVPLFFHRDAELAVEYSGRSGQITHGDKKAYDACRYYGALIVAALRGETKEQLLDREFYSKHRKWFGQTTLHADIKHIAQGSYQKNGYEGGIRGRGYIVNALEAALWAFWSDGDSFERGALAAVNLGDDTDTTAAIYGQLAGAYYGYRSLPQHWLEAIYARTFMEKLSKWIAYEGDRCPERF